MQVTSGGEARRRELHTVLLVDDDEPTLAAYANGLASKWSLLVTSSCAAACRLVRQHRVDGAIVDLCLRDGTGLDLLRDFKIVNPAIVFVMVSGYGSVTTAKHALRAGADDVLTKPVSHAELMRALQGDDPDAREVATPTFARAAWEHVHRVVDDCDGNLSLSARKLGIGRGTLRRWLTMPAPKR